MGIAGIGNPVYFASARAEHGTVKNIVKLDLEPAIREGRRKVEAQVDERKILVIVERHNADCGGLMAILEEIQESYGYLPEAALRVVAHATQRSLVDVYGVATFYHSFSLEPRGRHLVCACQGTACHVRGAAMIVKELERQLGIKAGQTTPDGEFTLETANCLGACALGPIVVVDGTYHSKVDVAAVKDILGEVQTVSEQLDLASVPASA